MAGVINSGDSLKAGCVFTGVMAIGGEIGEPPSLSKEI